MSGSCLTCVGLTSSGGEHLGRLLPGKTMEGGTGCDCWLINFLSSLRSTQLASRNLAGCDAV